MKNITEEEINTLMNLLNIYTEALRIICGGDKELGMEVLNQACESLDLEFPVIACDVAR